MAPLHPSREHTHAVLDALLLHLQVEPLDADVASHHLLPLRSVAAFYRRRCVDTAGQPLLILDAKGVARQLNDRDVAAGRKRIKRNRRDRGTARNKSAKATVCILQALYGVPRKSTN